MSDGWVITGQELSCSNLGIGPLQYWVLWLHHHCRLSFWVIL